MHVAGTGIAVRVTPDRHVTLSAPAGKVVVVRNPRLRFAGGPRTWTLRDSAIRGREWRIEGTVDGRPFTAQGPVPRAGHRTRWVGLIPIAIAAFAVLGLRDRRRRRSPRTT